MQIIFLQIGENSKVFCDTFPKKTTCKKTIFLNKKQLPKKLFTKKVTSKKIAFNKANSKKAIYQKAGSKKSASKKDTLIEIL